MKFFSGLFLLIGGLQLVALPVHAQMKRPPAELLAIENGTVKIGIDRAMGASITWLSWKEHPENVINLHDSGRLIQQSYYAGKSLDRQAEGQSKHWSPWSWNPIQGGGVNSWARVTTFQKTKEGNLYAETVPKLWDMPNEEAAALMQQTCKIEPDMPNVVQVHNVLICKREVDDRWGPAVPRHQEIPACYFTRQFQNTCMYLGNGQWEAVSQKPGPPWGRAQPKLNAMACFNDQDQGIAVYSPVANAHWNFGPVGGPKPGATPTDGACVHLAPITTVKLGPKTTLDYRYWLIVGSKAQVAACFDQLLAKYKDEKMNITEGK